MRMRLVPATAIAALGLLLVACGGSDNEPAPEEEAGAVVPEETTTEEAATAEEEAEPTKDEYIAAADEICDQANRDLRPVDEALAAAWQQLTAAITPDAATAYAQHRQAGLDIRDQATEDLRALESPPEGPAEEYLALRDEQSDNFRRAIAQTKKLSGEITQENATALAVIEQEAGKTAKKAQRAAKKYGFKVCGIPPKM